ncbi:unnamed protein product [Adineta steineri]|uniref:Uncharacterized protein n=1 Tax=Adineta steineri TaxID=433720 RepID=A0A819QNL8_9BILA|nr:unnamed protein product [Adineta steineri]
MMKLYIYLIVLLQIEVVFGIRCYSCVGKIGNKKQPEDPCLNPGKNVGDGSVTEIDCSSTKLCWKAISGGQLKRGCGEKRCAFIPDISIGSLISQTCCTNDLYFHNLPIMSRRSLSEESLVRFEQYLNTNPYREYSMSKPYFPKTSQMSTHSNRLIPQQQSSMLAFHELMDNSKNSLTLDRIAYKLRMKSDLNIDTLRETDVRRRHYHRHQQFPSKQSPLNLEVSDITSSILPPTLTKTFTRQPPAITISTDAMKTLMNDDLNGIEGNAVRVGTIDELIKRFRQTEHQLIRRPTDYVGSPSPSELNNISRNGRPVLPKSRQQHQEPQIKQPQGLTEYSFKAPTFPSISTRIPREAKNSQKFNYPNRIRERYNTAIHNTSTDNADTSLLHQCPLNSPEQHHRRLNSFISRDQPTIELSSHDKRIQESREKSLMRFEKQLCTFNKLTIGDPFNYDQMDPTIYQFQQPLPITSYIFPPVRPFGYFTKKPQSTSDIQQSSDITLLSPHTNKNYRINKKKSSVVSRTTLDSLDKNEKNDNLHIKNTRMKSLDSLSDNGDGVHNTTIDVDLNAAGTFIPQPDEDDEPE